MNSFAEAKRFSGLIVFRNCLMFDNFFTFLQVYMYAVKYTKDIVVETKRFQMYGVHDSAFHIDLK